MEINEWYELLTEMTEGTEYEVIIKTKISNPLVAITPKYRGTPQRIAIYPKKTQNPGGVIEKDVYEMSKIQALLGEPKRIKSNRPHYCDIPEQTIIKVCKIFLLKE